MKRMQLQAQLLNLLKQAHIDGSCVLVEMAIPYKVTNSMSKTRDFINGLQTMPTMDDVKRLLKMFKEDSIREKESRRGAENEESEEDFEE